MKVYMLVSGYKSVDNYNDYAKTPFATKELAAAAFERKLKYAFENDDVDGHSYKDCLASPSSTMTASSSCLSKSSMSSRRKKKPLLMRRCKIHE